MKVEVERGFLLGTMTEVWCNSNGWVRSVLQTVTGNPGISLVWQERREWSEPIGSGWRGHFKLLLQAPVLGVFMLVWLSAFFLSPYFLQLGLKESWQGNIHIQKCRISLNSGFQGLRLYRASLSWPARLFFCLTCRAIQTPQALS